jgi:hypothetical protein
VLLATLQLGVVGCDHLRAKDAAAEQANQSEKPAAPSSMVPPSDRYANGAADAH